MLLRKQCLCSLLLPGQGIIFPLPMDLAGLIRIVPDESKLIDLWIQQKRFPDARRDFFYGNWLFSWLHSKLTMKLFRTYRGHTSNVRAECGHEFSQFFTHECIELFLSQRLTFRTRCPTL